MEGSQSRPNGQVSTQGRKASVDVAAVKELHQSGLGVSAIAKQLNIGR